MSVSEPSFTVEDINPEDFADGVFYLPLGIELQPRSHRWGYPDRARLRELVAQDRPHGASGRKLLCLLCMRQKAVRGQAVEPVWMTLVETRFGPVFRHENGRSPHEEHTPESDTHKALKEREASAWEAAGAEVQVEEWRPRAKRRPDVLAVGARLTVAGEVQHSTISASVVGRRQKALAAAGHRVVWTTGRDATDVDFLRRVPHLAVPALDDHRLYLRARTPTLNVVTGWTFFEAQRCGWADLWRGVSRCPVSGRAAPCGRLHLYPTLNAKEYKSDPDAMFPFGETVHLDHLLEGILHETWVPYRAAESRTTWVPAAAYERVVDERGEFGDPDMPGRLRGVRREARRVCERNGRTAAAAPPALPAPAVVVPAAATVPESAAVEQAELPGVGAGVLCCGARSAVWAGGPLQLGCQLCRNSPTYYGR
ncbi:competence protein CoiA family protein [Actinoplanes sp. NPDC049681]|uniref:competence protein CoiA family protein n=1 Tax=Actinoplanes sp. NPDC049681 TaxID=3363905 RepID=UPI0037A8378A